MANVNICYFHSSLYKPVYIRIVMRGCHCLRTLYTHPWVSIDSMKTLWRTLETVFHGLHRLQRDCLPYLFNNVAKQVIMVDLNLEPFSCHNG
jgi:hypothetical protein